MKAAAGTSGKDGHGRTRAEREERRQRIAAAGAAQALGHHMTMRCRYARELDEAAGSAPGTDAEKNLRAQAREQHGQCHGESRGGTGCMCTCHDPLAEVLAG